MIPFFSHFKSLPLIGLDIRANEIRLLQLQHKKNKWVVKNSAIAELSATAIQEGKIIEFDHVIEAIQSIVKKTRTTGCKAAIALPANGVIIKTLKLPKELSNRECELEIETHRSHYLPGITDEIIFDFIIQDGNNSVYHNVLLVATKKELLETYCEAVNSSGLKVNIVDVDIYALARSASKNILSNDHPIAIVDINFDNAYFIVLQKTHIIFYQLIYFTPDHFISKLQQSLQACYAMHHTIEIKHIFLSGKSSQITPFLGELSTELNLSLHHAFEFTLASGLVMRGQYK